MLRISFLLLFCVQLWAVEPDALYLTWVKDPTSTMTVVWLGGDGTRVYYRPLNPTWGYSKWRSAESESNSVVHVSHIEGLRGDSGYVFHIEGSEEKYQFRTLPATLSREVRFVVGGDIYYYRNHDNLVKMNQVIGDDDPDFVVLGGDIAYTNGSKQAQKNRSWKLNRWEEFFKTMAGTMKGKENRLIPMIPVIGNHDVESHRLEGELFYKIFPFPEDEKVYRKMVFGNYLDLVLLDTGHTWPIEGTQTEWLQKSLDDDKAPYLFAVYHVGAYPSHYPYEGKAPKLLRKNWSPLFEEAQMTAVFENHNHMLKRTKPMNGVVYLGDGSWGASPRSMPKQRDYIEMVRAINACWFVHLTKNRAQIEARTSTGEVADQIEFPPRRKL